MRINTYRKEGLSCIKGQPIRNNLSLLNDSNYEKKILDIKDIDFILIFDNNSINKLINS